MKTFKFKSLKMPFCTLLLAAFLSGSALSCQDANSEKKQTLSQASVEKPKIDLATAAFYGNLDAVKQHIEFGTDLNTKDPMSGSTPLITAITFKKDKIANALIDAGADLSVKNNDGSTALHVAAFFCRVEMVQKLLDVGVDKSIKNNFGATARESVMGSFEEVKPVYDFMQTQLGPLGLELDMEELEKARPVVAMMLQ